MAKKLQGRQVWAGEQMDYVFSTLLEGYYRGLDKGYLAQADDYSDRMMGMIHAYEIMGIFQKDQFNSMNQMISHGMLETPSINMGPIDEAQEMLEGL